MKTKNSYPSSEFESKDRCPSCSSFCNIHTDLDDNDNCNDCRIFEDNLETASIDYRDKSDDENTDEETMLINVNWYDKQEAFIAGAKWQQERSYSEEEVRELVTDYEYAKFNSSVPLYFTQWFEQFKKK
jgi:hypothetical protein